MGDSDGNSAQVRAMAKTLFDTWRAEEELNNRKSFITGSIPAWFACIVSSATLIWGAAVLASDVKENRRDIEVIQNANLGERLARIEAQLVFLVSEAKEKEERK